MEIDLQQFCSDDELRVSLAKPFSHGDYTYATNGIYAVRIPRREDIPVIEGGYAKALDRFIDPVNGAAFLPIDISLPSMEEPSHKEKCEDCDGRGTEHECPDCDCECVNCGGSGEVVVEEHISVSAFGGIYRLPYLRRILALPGVELADLPRDHETPKPALFRFEGGVAVLMACRKELATHVHPKAIAA